MVLPWKRFWVPLGSEISCGISRQDFFDDPEAKPGFLNKSARRLDDLASEPCLVLLGEPGLGKSIALEQAFPGIDHASGGNEKAVWIRFRDIPDASTFKSRTVESTRWRSWLEGDYQLTLILDGLDEGLINIKNFVSFLTFELRACPLTRLRVLVACRTADWPVAAGQQLLELWKTDLSRSAWELCPLRRVDAVSAADSIGVSPRDFLDQIFAKHVVTLAARPTTLFFLLRQFKRNGQLEGGHRVIYERGILDLCREPDLERSEANKSSEKDGRLTSPEKLRDEAAFLGALMILSGRSAISISHREDTALEGDLHLYSLVGNEKVRGSGIEPDILATTNTALFSSRGENRVGFAHQSFAECLAARRVCNLPLVQLRKLFCGLDRNAEHVIPQLAETAAWVAGANDDFLTHLLEIDPEILLRSDVARIQGNRKKQIVDAILEKSKQLELFDNFDTRRFLSGLKHDHLAEQLWEYIKDDRLNVSVRRLALEIAEECRLADLNDDLLRMLHRPEVDQRVKESAARVLLKTLPTERLIDFEPLVQGRCGPDPEDQLKGYGLIRLVPGHWSLSESLEHISPPKDESFHGSYWVFLNHNCLDAIKVEDLGPLLNWLLNVDQCFDVLNPFCGLAYTGICLALRNLDRPEIRDSAIRLWKKDFYRHRSHRTAELEKLRGNESIRQSFAFYVLQDPETTKDDVVHLLSVEFSLLEGSDFEWLLQVLPTIEESRLAVWVLAIWLLSMRTNIAKCWDLFLQRLDEVPLLRSKFELLRAWNLDEPIAIQAKADHLLEQQRRQRIESGISASDLEARIEYELKRVSEGEPSSWANLCSYLSLKEGDTHYPQLLPHDVTQMPGWLKSDEKRRTLIKAAANEFLQNCSDDFETLRTRSTFSDPGYLAIWLLRGEFDADAVLRRGVAKNWIHSIVGRFNNGEDHHQEMVALAYRANPDETIDALREEAEESFRRHGYILSWRAFGTCWDARLSAVLGEFAISHSTRREAITTSLCSLFDYDIPGYLKWMRRVLPRISRLSDETRVAIAAAAHALSPAETWELVWDKLCGEVSFAEKVFLTIAGNLELGDRRRNPNLTPERLGQSVELLYKLFPPSEIEHKSGYVSPRQAIADRRRWMTDLLTACPDREAGDQLIRLAKLFPEHQIEFRYRYQDHLKTRRRQLWEPPSPTDLVEIITRSEARLVRSGGDLFELLLESLRRFEDFYSRSELRAFDRLWRWQGSGNRRSQFEPKDEESLSDELARWLKGDIGKESGIVVGREVQVERGMKTDLLVTAISLTGDGEKDAAELHTVIVEVKGCWNTRVKEDLEDQLVAKYLVEHAWQFGIYVVGWFLCEKWQDGKNYLASTTLESAKEEVARLAQDASNRHPELILSGGVLDCRYR
jgi:hypothetical protein